MDWNADRVVTALVGERGEQDAESDDAIIQQFRTFFHEFSTGAKYPYREEIEQRRNREDYWIELNLDDMAKPNPSYDVSRFVDAIKRTPARYLPLLNEAARREATSTLPEDGIQIPSFLVTLKPPRDSVSIKDINEGSVGSLIAVRGLVLQSSRVSCALSDAVIQCRSCRSIKTIHIDPIALLRSGGHFTLPATCDNSRTAPTARGFEVGAGGAKPLNCGRNPYSLVHAQSTFVDFQTIRLQERHEDLLMGDMPRHIRLIMQRNLVNRLKPGMNVTVYGILQTGLVNTEDASVHSNFLAVVGLRDDSINDRLSEDSESSLIPRSISTSDEEKFRQISQIQNVIDLIAASIEPAIYGHESVKLALAAMLFGGRRTVLSDGMRIRGDINVLLLGDPGTAKSQFLKFVNQVAPLSVFTSGKGSSAAGLTASVIKEPASGEWYLEGGAMVLADGGVVCIDEFDKMNEEDRVAIHEAMEQQTISIAKAGITTVLNSRCSVLAAANPVFGSFDDFRSAAENIDFQTTILSRFDLIFLIRDAVDAEEDKAIAEKVILLRTDEGDKGSNELISPSILKDYIAYARKTCHPNLSEEAARVLQDGYVEMRSELEKRKRESADGFVSRADKHIPITVRQLEALIRISQAFARMTLQPEVTEYHAQRALELFRSANDLAIQQQQGPAPDGDAISRSAGRIPGTGGPGFFKRIEDEIRMQIRVGTEMSYQVLCDNVRRVLNVTIDEVRRVCEAMISREELEQRARRKRIFRRR